MLVLSDQLNVVVSGGRNFLQPDFKREILENSPQHHRDIKRRAWSRVCCLGCNSSAGCHWHRSQQRTSSATEFTTVHFSPERSFPWPIQQSQHAEPCSAGQPGAAVPTCSE